MTVTITQSSLRLWRRCRRAYYYKYIECLRPRRVSRPLTFGSAIHKIIEYHIEGKTTAEAIAKVNEKRSLVFAAEVDYWDEIIRDAEVIMQAYFTHWKSDPLRYHKINGRLAEHEFSLELAKGIVLRGVIDAIPRTRDKRYWVMEHKSRRGRIENDTVRMRDVQTMLYSRVAQECFGISVAGVLWDYVRSKTPVQPDLLKTGTLSKKRIDTLPVMYENAIKQHGLDRSHYLDVLGVLDENQKAWFSRVYMPINRDAIGRLVEETVVTAREIDKKAGVDTSRNLTKECQWCEYENLCRADLFNSDTAFIKEREFRVDERAHPELSDEAE